MKCFTKVLVLLSVATPLWACEACREALGKLGLAKAYNWSILLMLAVPVLVIATISGLIVKAHRKTHSVEK